MPIARSNGCKISYEVSGDGPALVLHPGMFQDGAHWAHSGYTSALTSTHTVITVDPLGLGGSDAPHQAEDYSLERRVDSVTAVLDEVGVERAALWGYSLGAMTGYAVAAHTPDRLTCLVAGGFDPVDGFRSVVGPTLRLLGLPADTDAYTLMKQGAVADPYQAALIEAGDPAGFRANYEAFSREPGLGLKLADSGVPMLLYAGTADPWHEPMRAFAESSGATFLSISGADHKGCWDRSTDVLPTVLSFLAANAGMP
ncbi:alpha/beta fold hydrolase [Nonomuraea jabiensis]|uniref:Pimeloyl-ACP methyl ester carboxylesterase n=1 Tax=Nonomuraea jabiensis TaxID=882448 RepID=A0A7W9LFK7_9ACTN|nr:alpha/beta hydrolase [Nonomuraea jabiensis]MBB5781873.1 pimeloyl-ACP methyl ester carboxylesterase [Nonomuraea jabiensis]